MWLTIVRQAMVTWRLVRDGRVPLHAKLAFFLPLAYIIFPLDFLPDFIPGLGQLDDIGLLLIGMQLLQQFTPQTLLEEIRTGVRRSTAPDTVNVDNHREENSYRNGVR